MTARRSQDGFEAPPDAESRCDEMLAPLRGTFERLVALASLRGKDTRQYSSTALDAAFAPAVVTQVLSKRHEHTFREWLGLGLEYQHTQLSEFLAARAEEGRPAVLQDATALVPASASAAERRLFLDDFHLVLSLIDSD